MGRKTKLTPEVQKRICEIIRAGNFAATAASVVGIDESTFYRWMSEGEKATRGQYREFRNAVKKASAEAEQKNVKYIQSAAPKNWQAAAWWLERRNPDTWGRKDRHEHTGADGGPIQEQITLDFASLTDDDLATLEQLGAKAAAGAVEPGGDPG